MPATQLLVIGAGPGGYAAAFYAADLGLSVALVDPEPNPGGVCLFRGCIPSKALLHVAKVIGEAKHAAAWGVAFGEPKIDVAKVRAFKDQVVTKLTGGVGQLAKMRKINYVQGRASFTDARTVSIELVKGGTDTLTFDHAIIATGSRPAAVPGLSIDSPRVMYSTSGLDLPDVPKTLLVVGGGYIGVVRQSSVHRIVYCRARRVPSSKKTAAPTNWYPSSIRSMKATSVPGRSRRLQRTSCLRYRSRSSNSLGLRLFIRWLFALVL
jgi:dihydrolipoamide dehydrogenase